MTEYELAQLNDAIYAANRADQAMRFASLRWSEGRTRKARKSFDFALAQLREALRCAENAAASLNAEVYMSGGQS